MEEKEPEKKIQQNESDTIEGEDLSIKEPRRELYFPIEKQSKKILIKKDNLYRFLLSIFHDSETRVIDRLYHVVIFFATDYITKNMKINHNQINIKNQKHLFESKNRSSKSQEKKLAFQELVSIEQKGKLKYISIYKNRKIFNTKEITYILKNSINDINSLKLLRFLIILNKDYENIRKSDRDKILDELNKKILTLKKYSIKYLIFENDFKSPLIEGEKEKREENIETTELKEKLGYSD